MGSGLNVMHLVNIGRISRENGLYEQLLQKRIKSLLTNTSNDIVGVLVFLDEPKLNEQDLSLLNKICLVRAAMEYMSVYFLGDVPDKVEELWMPSYYPQEIKTAIWTYSQGIDFETKKVFYSRDNEDGENSKIKKYFGDDAGEFFMACVVIEFLEILNYLLEKFGNQDVYGFANQSNEDDSNTNYGNERREKIEDFASFQLGKDHIVKSKWHRCDGYILPPMYKGKIHSNFISKYFTKALLSLIQQPIQPFSDIQKQYLKRLDKILIDVSGGLAIIKRDQIEKHILGGEAMYNVYKYKHVLELLAPYVDQVIEVDNALCLKDSNGKEW